MPIVSFDEYIGTAPGQGTPQSVPTGGTSGTVPYREQFAATASKYGVPEDLLIAQAEQESNFDPSAVSKAGAQGISQFMPATAKDMGLADPFDPAQSIEAQGKYMRQLLDRYQGDETKALAAYNAGMGNVDKAGGVPDFPETQDYIKRIAERRKKYVGADVSAALTEAIPTGKQPAAQPQAASNIIPFDDVLSTEGYRHGSFQQIEEEYPGPVASALKMGLYDIMSGAVGLGEMARIPGADVAQSWVGDQIEGVMGKMSPEDQMNFQREFASLDENSVWRNPSSLMYQMVRQMPQLLTFMIPVGVIAKAGTAAKGVKGIAAAKKARQIKAAKVGAGIEAAQGAGFASAEISQAIDAATEVEMYESQAYAELRAGGMDDAAARKQIKQDAQALGGLIAGVGSAAVGYVGGKAFAKILTDKNSTITKAVRNGVITQAAEEAPQEMFEQAGANIGQAAQGIPVEPTAGLLEAGVAGATLGGGMGGGAALVGRAIPTGTEAKEEGLVTERAAQTEAKKVERATQMAIREKTTAAGRAKADELGVDILNDMGETEPSGVGGKYSDIDVQFRYEEMQDEAKATAAEEAKVAEETARKEEIDAAAEEADAQPAAYLLAQENNVDLADVKPTGGKYNNIITKADVRKVIGQRAKEDKRVAKAEAKAVKEATKAAKVAPTTAAAATEAGPETDPYKLARAEDYGSVEAKAALEATDHALADVRTEYGLGKGQLLTKKQVDKYVNARAEDRGMNPQLKSYFAEKNAEFAAADIPEVAIGDLTRNDANKVTKASIDVDFENASPAAAAMTEFEGAAVVSADAMDESVPMATVGQGLSDFIDSTPHKTGKGTTPEKKNQWRLNQTQALADVAARVDRHLANTEERYEAGEIQGYKDDLLDGIIAWKEMDNEAVLKNAPGAETGYDTILSRRKYLNNLVKVIVAHDQKFGGVTDVITEKPAGPIETKIKTKKRKKVVDKIPPPSKAATDYAKKHGVDIAKVKPTGKRGNVVYGDVQKVVAAAAGKGEKKASAMYYDEETGEEMLTQKVTPESIARARAERQRQAEPDTGKKRLGLKVQAAVSVPTEGEQYFEGKRRPGPTAATQKKLSKRQQRLADNRTFLDEISRMAAEMESLQDKQETLSIRDALQQKFPAQRAALRDKMYKAIQAENKKQEKIARETNDVWEAARVIETRLLAGMKKSLIGKRGFALNLDSIQNAGKLAEQKFKGKQAKRTLREKLRMQELGIIETDEKKEARLSTAVSRMQAVFHTGLETEDVNILMHPDLPVDGGEIVVTPVKKTTGEDIKWVHWKVGKDSPAAKRLIALYNKYPLVRGFAEQIGAQGSVFEEFKSLRKLMVRISETKDIADARRLQLRLDGKLKSFAGIGVADNVAEEMTRLARRMRVAYLERLDKGASVEAKMERLAALEAYGLSLTKPEEKEVGGPLAVEETRDKGREQDEFKAAHKFADVIAQYATGEKKAAGTKGLLISIRANLKKFNPHISTAGKQKVAEYIEQLREMYRGTEELVDTAEVRTDIVKQIRYLSKQYTDVNALLAEADEVTQVAEGDMLLQNKDVDSEAQREDWSDYEYRGGVSDDIDLDIGVLNDAPPDVQDAAFLAREFSPINSTQMLVDKALSGKRLGTKERTNFNDLMARYNAWVKRNDEAADVSPLEFRRLSPVTVRGVTTRQALSMRPQLDKETGEYYREYVDAKGNSKTVPITPETAKQMKEVLATLQYNLKQWARTTEFTNNAIVSAVQMTSDASNVELKNAIIQEGGAIPLSDALSILAKTSDLPFVRTLANKLRKIDTLDVPVTSERLEDNIPGQYRYLRDRDTGEVLPGTRRIRLDFKTPDLVRTLLHEAVHAYTIHAMKTDNAVAMKLEGIRAAAEAYAIKEHGTENYKDIMPELYGLTSVEEFIAEAMTNQKFQHWLRNNSTTKQSFWDRMMAIVKRALGLNTTRTSVMDAVMSTDLDSLFMTEKRIMESRGTDVRNVGDSVANMKNVVRKASASIAQPLGVDPAGYIGDTVAASVATTNAGGRGLKDKGGRVALALHTMDQLARRFKKSFATSDIDRGSYNPLTDYMMGLRETVSTAKEVHQKAERMNKQLREYSDRAKDGGLSLFTVMQDSTLLGVHPDLPLDDPANVHLKDDAEAKKVIDEYATLPSEAKDAYVEARNYFKGQFKDFREKSIFALARAQTGVTPQAAEIISKIATYDEFKSRFGKVVKSRAFHEAMQNVYSMSKVVGPYFPIQRFGDYVVTVRSTSDNADDAPKNVHFSTHKSRAQAELAHAKMMEEYGGKAGYTVLPMTRKLKGGLPSGTGIGPLVNKMKKSLESVPGASASIETAFIEMMADHAFRKSQLKRQGIAGAKPAEMRQSIAERAYSGGWAIADLTTAVDRAEAMREMTKMAKGPSADIRMGDVVNELQARELQSASDRAVHGIERVLTKLGFLGYLATPSYAVVNSTQVPLITLPYLGAKFGWGKTAAQLGKTWTQVFKPVMKELGNVKFGLAGTGENILDEVRKTLTTGQKEMIDVLVKRGIIDATFAQELYEAAKGEGQSKIVGGVMEFARTAPQAIEILNRVTTAVAAYELSGGDIEVAGEAVSETQFDYSDLNKPRAFKFTGGRAIMMFKMYGQGMYALLIKNFVQSMPGKEGAAEARKALAGLVATHTVAAGALGGIFIEPLRWVINGVMAVVGDDDEDFDLDVEVRKFLADAVGPELGELLAMGVPQAALGISMQSRVGLQDLAFMGMRDTDNYEQTFIEATMTATGPIGAIIRKAFKGAQHIKDGDFTKGLQNMAPKAARDVMQAWAMHTEGMLDSRGNLIESPENFSAWNKAVKAFGFTPAEVSELWDTRNAQLGTERFATNRRQKLIQRWRNTDPKKRARFFRDNIVPFSRQYPEIRITMGHLRKSLKASREFERETKRGARLQYKFGREAGAFGNI